MTRRPHDALFKLAFGAPASAAALLRGLLPAELRDAIAWETMKGERGSFVDAELADRHGDLVFSAQLRASESARVLLWLEHQSTSDPTMPLRTATYQTQIWNQLCRDHLLAPLPPVISVVVSHAPGGWTIPRCFEDMLDRRVLAIPGVAALVPRFSLIVDDLATQSNAELQARSLAAYQRVVLWLLRDARDPVRLLGSFDAWSSTMLEIERSPGGSDAFRTLLVYLFRVIGPVHLESLRAKLRQLGNRAEKATMTIAEYLHEEGRKEGHRQGRVATLRSLLVFKFKLGALDEAFESRLRAAAPDAIDRYLQRVLTANSVAAVFDDVH